MRDGVLSSDVREVLKDRELVGGFAGSRVLVTGCSGLIGSMLARVLDAANEEYGLGIQIVGHAREAERVRSALGSVADRIEIIYSDDFDVEVGCDYVFHTACPTASRFFVECPVETIETMVGGTKAMLELAKRRDAIIVYLSSMEEYGVPYVPGDTMTEDKVGVIDHLAPRGSYPEGKRLCECMCAAYASEYGVDARIARLAQTFGAGIPLTDNRVSMQFARSVVEGRDIVLHTEGRSVSNYCYLTDAVAGLLAVAVRGRAGEAYNVCNDAEARTILEIAELVAEEVSGGVIGVARELSGDRGRTYAPDNTMRMDSGKLRGLGWVPKVGMREGYERLVRCLVERDGHA